MNRLTDQDLDVSVAMVLRVGVTLAAAVSALGGALLGSHLFGPLPDYTRFQPGDPGLRSVAGTVQGAINLTPKSVIQLGLLLLIATPVARVAVCIFGFARQHNGLYVAVSTIVLSILVLSFMRSSFW
jgi:uncharacterized membrane protein